MKKHLPYYFLFVIIGATFISSTLSSGNSPGKKTGSPLDGASCIQCHTGNEVINQDWITTNIPETGWITGETYTVTALATHETSTKIGFELTAENNTEKTGTFALLDDARSKVLFNGASVTHTGNGTAVNDGQNTWSFDWTAPDTDQGDITFYAAFNATNSNGTTSGDQIITSSLLVAQDVSSTAVSTSETNPFRAFPNPAKNLLFIESPNEIQNLRIYNLSGRNVKTISTINDTKMKLNIEGLSPGMYLLKANTEIGEVVQKIQIK